jgi:hypothetical protein
VGLVSRRTFLVIVPQSAAALTAAYAFGSAHGSRCGPADASLPGDAASDPHPPNAPGTAPDAQDQESAPRRVQPLPLPPEDDRAWLQEWLDLSSLTSRRPDSGC